MGELLRRYWHPIDLPEEHSYYSGYEVTGGPFGNDLILTPSLVAHLSDDAGIEL